MKRALALLFSLTLALSPVAGLIALAEGGALSIESAALYPDMEKTYAEGYVPAVRDGKVIVVLPLIGEVSGEVAVTPELGGVSGPFIASDYTQRAAGTGRYIFRFEIPLRADRANGSYPVRFAAAYTDRDGAPASQTFTVQVVITDGTGEPAPTAEPTPTAEPERSGGGGYVPSADMPELYIASCAVTPATVGGDEVFTVAVTIKNIGNQRARACKLLYGSDSDDIAPTEFNNAILFGEIKSGGEVEAEFRMKTDRNARSGRRAFFITLSCSARTGGTFETRRDFYIRVEQPCSVGFDEPALQPKVTAGESVTLSANVFNTGKSPVFNVTVSLAAAGLFPAASVFLGDIAPGEAGYGEMKVFVGMLSMTEGYTQSYGKTAGTYTIRYEDEAGEVYAIEREVKTEILPPEIAPTPAPPPESMEPVSEWWITALVGFALIAILVTGAILSRMSRAMRMRD